MAEEKAQEATSSTESSASTQKKDKPILFIALSVFNILVVLGVGAMLYMGKKKQEQTTTIDQVIEGERMQQEQDVSEDPFIGEFIPIETFFVNLAGTRGGKIARVTLELEVEQKGVEISEEIERRKPQIRDIIIIILSSKTYEQISEREGKDNLREEIKTRLNSFLTRGKVKSVLFTEFLLN